MKKRLTMLALLALCLPMAALEWKFSGTREGWERDRHLTPTVTDGGLLMELTGSYSNIETSRGMEFKPDGCEVMVIKYSATGLKRNGGGQIYFGTKEDPHLDENKKFYVNSLNFDGQEHDLFVNLKDAAKGTSYDTWRKASAITDVRIDLVNEFPARVLLKSISFIGQKEYDSLRGAKYDELGVPMRLPVYLPNGDPKTKEQLRNGDAIFKSEMVAPAGHFEYVGLNYLRMEFNLEDTVEKNLWQSVCDDQIEGAWLNGRPITCKWSMDWQVMNSFEIPNDFFAKGRNVLCVVYRNGSSLGGLMMDLQIIDSKGRYSIVTPDKATGMGKAAPEGWNMPDFKDKWPAVETRPGPPAAPWVNFSPFYRRLDTGAANVTIVPERFDRFKADVRFVGSTRFGGDEVFFARFCSEDGDVLADFKGTAKDLGGKVASDGSVRITFKAFPGERYGSASKCSWEFGVQDRETKGGSKFGVNIAEKAVPGKPIAVKLEKTGRGPVPMLNGKPFYFNVLTVHNYSNGYKGKASGMEGPKSPFNVIAIRLGGSGDTNWWIGPDKYDFSAVDRNLSLMLERYPDSMLGLYVWCHPGNWYRQVYPERMSLHEDGRQYAYYVAAVSFSNAEVRKDAQKAVAELVKHIEKYFGSRTVLYNLMGGISCEWQGWSAHSDTFSDFSEGGTRDFIEYAKANGVEVEGVPGGVARKASVGGVFRNPVRDRDAILYDKFYSESIAECVAGIAKAAKAACNGRKLVGAYYGYLFEYASLGYCANAGGHNAMHILLDSP